MTETNEDALLSEYTKGAVTWDSLVGDDATKANRVFHRLHQLAKELRKTPHGRAGLASLTDHDVAGIRLLAATEALAWEDKAALPSLEAIEGSQGLHALSAKYTLKSYRAGTLDLDW